MKNKLLKNILITVLNEMIDMEKHRKTNGWIAKRREYFKNQKE